jgi:hypothetical protein
MVNLVSANHEEETLSDDVSNHDSGAPARSVLALVGFVAARLGAALIGSGYTAPSIPDWYESLVKPLFTPPSWLFGAVWTVTYLTTAFRLAGVARRE